MHVRVIRRSRRDCGRTRGRPRRKQAAVRGRPVCSDKRRPGSASREPSCRRMSRPVAIAIARRWTGRAPRDRGLRRQPPRVRARTGVFITATVTFGKGGAYVERIDRRIVLIDAPTLAWLLIARGNQPMRRSTSMAVTTLRSASVVSAAGTTRDSNLFRLSFTLVVQSLRPPQTPAAPQKIKPRCITCPEGGASAGQETGRILDRS
jgi:hypothetical protein